MIYLTKEQFNDIVNHAKNVYPNEACGILAGIEAKVLKVYKMINTSNNPEICYFMKPEEQLKVFKEMRLLGIDILGIYHSHSSTPAYPSARDCEMAFYPGVDYVIISLKDFNNPEVHAFKIAESKIKEEQIIIRKNIIFICIENSCRSQIAEGIVNNLYWQKLNAYSAGSKPSGTLNPQAIAVMKEIGIDISKQKSKGFDQIKDIEFDYAITMGCNDVCPVFLAKNKLNWQIDDPKDKPIEFFRKVRDEIRNKISQFLDNLPE